jgi:hypothetical protein
VKRISHATIQTHSFRSALHVSRTTLQAQAQRISGCSRNFLRRWVRACSFRVRDRKTRGPCISVAKRGSVPYVFILYIVVCD